MPRLFFLWLRISSTFHPQRKKLVHNLIILPNPILLFRLNQHIQVFVRQVDLVVVVDEHLIVLRVNVQIVSEERVELLRVSVKVSALVYVESADVVVVHSEPVETVFLILDFVDHVVQIISQDLVEVFLFLRLQKPDRERVIQVNYQILPPRESERLEFAVLEHVVQIDVALELQTSLHIQTFFG